MGRATPGNKYNIIGHYYNMSTHFRGGLKPTIAKMESDRGIWRIVNSHNKESSKYHADILEKAYLLGFTHYSVKKRRGGGLEYDTYPVRIQKSIRDSADAKAKANKDN